MKIEFDTSVVTINDGIVHARFIGSGKENTLNTNWLNTDDYRKVAESFGYGDDWQRYAVEHELTHHWLADRLKLSGSFSLQEQRKQPWPPHIAWEEHLVNAIQRKYHTGASDPFGVPENIWRDSYPTVLEDWAKSCLWS